MVIKRCATLWYWIRGAGKRKRMSSDDIVAHSGTYDRKGVGYWDCPSSSGSIVIGDLLRGKYGECMSK